MKHKIFSMIQDLTPKGDQEKAIKELVHGIKDKRKFQTLLGITGSGKTFTMAKVIEEIGKPTLILAHNKTLAAQLFSEFKTLFPNNAVHYFVSYYDYYQPEAYVPSSDLYIEKDSQINEEIDRLRHATTNALLTRKDVIIIASVSCIYGIGSPEFYKNMAVKLKIGDEIDRDDFLRKLVKIQYERNDLDFYRGTFRVRGDVVEVFSADADRWAFKIEWFGDEVEQIVEVDPFQGVIGKKRDEIYIFPSSHYVVPEKDLIDACNGIRKDLQKSLSIFQSEMKYVEAQRLEFRTTSDLEFMETMGYCKGIENYSRYLDGRKPGEPPATLLDYFPEDFLMFIDESHQTLPQVRAMYKGDVSRKRNLVNYGFRLPSALDNRPLKFEEFEQRINQIVFVSATPGDYEFEKSNGVIVEQIIRPTGLLDPEIEVRPIKNQLDDLLNEIKIRIAKNEKILVVTLTKRMSEQLTEYYAEYGLKIRYLHSEIDTMDRVELLRDLRMGKFDVLVGINLLREGLDLPEVSLIAILDADVQGFLRSERSLFQICGRAARNSEGKVIMYADKISPAMQAVISETHHRRKMQEEFNKKHNIIPQTIIKDVSDINVLIGREPKNRKSDILSIENSNPDKITDLLEQLNKKMRKYARNLEFEEAAKIRDRIKELEEFYLLGNNAKT